MDFKVAIILYLVILFTLLVVTWKIGVNMFSSIVVSLMIAGVFLLILVPPNDLDKYTDNIIDGYEDKCKNSLAAGLICLIYVITLIIIVWYILDKAYYDIDESLYC